MPFPNMSHQNLSHVINPLCAFLSACLKQTSIATLGVRHWRWQSHKMEGTKSLTVCHQRATCWPGTPILNLTRWRNKPQRPRFFTTLSRYSHMKRLSTPPFCPRCWSHFICTYLTFVPSILIKCTISTRPKSWVIRIDPLISNWEAKMFPRTFHQSLILVEWINEDTFGCIHAQTEEYEWQGKEEMPEVWSLPKMEKANRTTNY